MEKCRKNAINIIEFSLKALVKISSTQKWKQSKMFFLIRLAKKLNNICLYFFREFEISGIFIFREIYVSIIIFLVFFPHIWDFENSVKFYHPKNTIYLIQTNIFLSVNKYF